MSDNSINLSHSGVLEDNPTCHIDVAPAHGSRAWAKVVLICFAGWLSACSSSGAQESPPPLLGDPESIEDPQGSESTPQVLTRLMSYPDLQATVPTVVHTQTMANSGLQISYTQQDLRVRAPASQIELQWIFMQRCLQQVAQAPLVLVRDGPAIPFTSNDDVVRNEILTASEITFVPIASASTLYGPVIQVSVDDFDGSLGTVSFNLRSIMGRHLWLAANLPERDYPFECALQQP